MCFSIFQDKISIKRFSDFNKNLIFVNFIQNFNDTCFTVSLGFHFRFFKEISMEFQ